MSVEFTPIDCERPDFGARVHGLNITTTTPEQIAILESAINRFGVLVFSEQELNDEQQFAFSAKFGPMESATGDIIQRDDRRLAMDINDISNLDREGNVRPRDDRARLFGLGNMLWHSDSSFKSAPAKYSLLSARVVPDKGGTTEFADMRAAWSTLEPELQQESSGLICEHSQIYSRGLLGFDEFTDEERAKWSPVHQPLVRRHPVTQAQSLFLSSHIGTIIGWPMPEARLFIRDLTEHATQDRFVFSHQWQPWDLVMWDNRVTMHRARRYDHSQPRDLHRTTVAGEKLESSCLN